MTDFSRICALIEERRAELFELLGKLVRIDSQNFGTHGNEEACARYIDTLCRELGLESDLYTPLEVEGFAEHPDALTNRGLHNRYNVTARWKGTEDRNLVMLMGHTDTVALGDAANWEDDPLSGIVKDGRIYGRGVGDDKYAIALSLFLIRLLKEEGFVPRANLLMTAYCDEEYGGSNGALAACMKYPTEQILNIDCEEMEIWNCAAGGGTFRYSFHTEQPVDTASVAARGLPIVLDTLEPFAVRRRAELEADPCYDNTIYPAECMRYKKICVGGEGGVDLGTGTVDFVVYTNRSREEIYAEFHALENELRERLAPLGLVGEGFTNLDRFFHYGLVDRDCEAIRTLNEATETVTGKPAKVCGGCLSDLSVLIRYGGKQAIGCGIARPFSLPGGCHQPNEYLECDKLVEFTKIIAAYLLRVLG